MSVLYLDTARLGQACASACQIQLDASRLAADDPSMYSEDFFREGWSAWPKMQRDRYNAFDSWRGVNSLKTRIANRFQIDSASDVFLANRSAQLVRLGARAMFRTCRNVLTSDLNWPQWQLIVADEAARSGQRVTVASVQNAVFNHGLSATQLAGRLEAVFHDSDCDGVFLPALSNLGIRIPLSLLLSSLNALGRLRFALIDAAQSFCHLPEPSPVPAADVTITGCHKWLRGFLPLGIAVCGRSLVAEQIQTILHSPTSSSGIDDPLLHFTQQICGGSPGDFSETICATPLFSASAAVHAMPSSANVLQERLSRQLENRCHIERAATGTAWQIVKTEPSLRSGILLMRSESRRIQNTRSESLRVAFCDRGVVLSTYPHGLVRISVPTQVLSRSSTDVLATAFAEVA